MSVLSNRRILVLAIGAFAVLGPAGLSASAAPSRSSGNEASVKSSQSVRGPRGQGLPRTDAEGPERQDGPERQPGQPGLCRHCRCHRSRRSSRRCRPESAHRASPAPARAPEYAYLYNAAVQTVPVESNVTLDTNGVMTSGITHTACRGITLVNIGVYRVTFSVSGTETSQFAAVQRRNVGSRLALRVRRRHPAERWTGDRGHHSRQRGPDTQRPTRRVPQLVSRRQVEERSRTRTPPS